MGTPLSEEEIIQKVKSGEIRYFEEIVRKYQEKVWRLCVSILGEYQAEDAAQEIFFRIYQSMDNFRGDASFSTWLYRIASNHCLNLLAKSKREKKVSLDDLIEKEGERAALLFKRSKGEPAEETREMAEALLGLLSPEERMILTLRELEGLSYKEIAETLNLSMDAVKVRIFRARQSLLGKSRDI